jgi:UTP--glucose-1-phosphate uridylyltransferase
MPTEQVELFTEKMKAAGLPKVVIDSFVHYYRKLRAGETGLIPEQAIEPVESLPDADILPARLDEVAREALPQTVLIKLNGGLGTSMGLEGPKSLLTVKEGLTFLDIAARQAERSGTPLLLMNSFSTRDDSLAALRGSRPFGKELPPDFLQHKVPKVLESDLSPANWPEDPELEWCPPGHGDIYSALLTSGMLHRLLEVGYRYAFVSNIDNLGAVADRRILGYFVEQGFPFLMEVSDRTPADRKGGHLALLPGGRMTLRETAQCPPEDRGAFEGIGRHRFFNTNNLWLHLPLLKRVLDERRGLLDLPMIRNRKHLDPRDDSSPAVFQLETAMGSAISVFAGATAIRVPRNRFAPVKKTGGLMIVRSDRYLLTDDFMVVPNQKRTPEDTIVDLDPRHYRLIDDLEARFPHGAPSLLRCESLKIRGDVRFGRGVKVEGKVRIVNESEVQAQIGDGELLTGEISFPRSRGLTR